MFGIENYASFVAAILVFQLVPGPGTIAILDSTARNGLRAGLAAVLGTLLGDACYMLAAVAGLAAVMKANPFAFSLLQWFGAAYLAWIGIGLLLRRVGGEARAREAARPPSVCFRQAFAVAITNPKVILFFVAFFPLFLRPEATGGTLAAMMLHVTLISFAYQALLVLAGNAVAAKLRGLPWARRVATRLAGVAFIGFGVKLALNNR